MLGIKVGATDGTLDGALVGIKLSTTGNGLLAGCCFCCAIIVSVYGLTAWFG